METNPFDDDYDKKPKAVNKKLVVLTKAQKEEIGSVTANEKDVDLMDLTRRIFKNPKLSGRSKEGIAIRKYLAEKNVSYKTRIHGKKEGLPPLTKGEMEFIETCASKGENALQIARAIYGGEHKNIKIKSLCREHRMVMAYMEENLTNLISESEKIVSGPYKPPSTFKQMVAKVNSITKENFIEGKMDTRTKKSIEKSLSFAQDRKSVV